MSPLLPCMQLKRGFHAAAANSKIGRPWTLHCQAWAWASLHMAVSLGLRTMCLQSLTSPAALLPCTSHTQNYFAHAKAQLQTWQPLDLTRPQPGPAWIHTSMRAALHAAFCMLMLSCPHTSLQSRFGLVQLAMHMMSGLCAQHSGSQSAVVAEAQRLIG